VLSTIAIDFTVMAKFWGGARRHPRASIGVHGKAAERLHGFLRALKNGGAEQRAQTNHEPLN
jgi:hypothetical protein